MHFTSFLLHFPKRIHWKKCTWRITLKLPLVIQVEFYQNSYNSSWMFRKIFWGVSSNLNNNPFSFDRNSYEYFLQKLHSMFLQDFFHTRYYCHIERNPHKIWDRFKKTWKTEFQGCSLEKTLGHFLNSYRISGWNAVHFFSFHWHYMFVRWRR